MVIHLFYGLNLCLLVSGLLAFRYREPDRRFALTLLRAILFLPLLSLEYIFFLLNFHPDFVPLILFSEAIFVLIWFSLANRLHLASFPYNFRPFRNAIIETVAGVVIVLIAMFYYNRQPEQLVRVWGDTLAFPLLGPITFFSFFQMAVMLLMIHRLEEFWKPLPLVRRWSYKYIVLGCFLVSFGFCIIATHRFLYLHFSFGELALPAVLFFFIFAAMWYAYTRHHLSALRIEGTHLDHPAMTPPLAAIFLCVTGFTAIGVHIFDKPMMLVLSLVITLAGLTTIVLVFSSELVNSAVKDFLGTHFSVKKYEYREAWLDFCNHLQGQFSKEGVAEALAQILAKTLYTKNVLVWSGSEKKGFSAAFTGRIEPDKVMKLAGDDPVFNYLKKNGHFYIRDLRRKGDWEQIAGAKREFLDHHNLVLLYPLLVSDTLVGLIGVGPEFHSGRYGRDDFDLLAALGTQAASALLTIDIAEELASVRERRVWDRFSTFVLHDIKNAANMLSLVRENADTHIGNPDFQQDMLECIDDALKRMAKVQDRLNLLRGKVSPKVRMLDMGEFLTMVCTRFRRTLAALRIEYAPPIAPVQVSTDPEMLFPVFENIILNAQEAGGDHAKIVINLERQGEWARITIRDNGPGIAEDLLPEALFEPFKTSKPHGSGIGLWQAKQMITFLGGQVSVANLAEGGACFEICLPLHSGIGLP